MALLPTQKAVLSGLLVDFDPATSGGDTFAGGPGGMLLVRNNDAASKTVTLAVPGNTEYGEPQPDKAIAVAAGTTKAIGGLTAGLRDPATGLIAVTYSAVTSVDVAYVEA